MENTFEFRLLNEFQRDFPLCPAPFAELAARLGVGERTVIGGLEKLRREGKISRVGAVFAPKRIGASTLAAMAVPSDQLEAVASAVNRFPEVNHNYEREHRYNLWFVVTAGSEGRLQATLGAIEKAAGYPLLALSLLEEFHIDLGFPLQGNAPKSVATAHPVQPQAPIGEEERRLVSVLQEWLPLFMRPFALIAERIGASENELMGRIGSWLENGAIKHFGVVVRHCELGYTANAMLVHDIHDERVCDIGRALAEEPAVTLCSIAGRACCPNGRMIHGRERTEV